jgi:ABC-type transporter Mla subunit MlaD
MARPSKLTDQQWSEIEKRLLNGESAASLSRAFKISKASVSSRFSERVQNVKSVAHQLVAADKAFSLLNVSEQIAARSLADDLKAISTHLAGAAKFGSMTAHRLSGIAHAQAEKVDDAEPEKSTEALQRIGVLTKMANASSEIGINLLRANKETVDDLNRGGQEKVPSGLNHFYGDN